ncbi:Type 1 glutamine amidotransferase-like domain-containing protein [Clostridium fungisolvens]|uniref:Peptidase E n=1 Tax=Clostridium fungisolvens TaxID=1604897 RepID=A0A6V8SI87_9CLOT|nr:Type 1 glutamine amidotransferase-like domain-containing protein [Clostridium fungisolvens]GFP76292.1 Peptidase E [Clostridium fungisolvens]
MSAYYLFSDFDMDKGFTAEVRDNLLSDIKSDLKIVFIASSPDFFEITDKYAKRYLGWFSDLGINFKSSKVIDNRMKKEEMLEHIRYASVVFLMGGPTMIQFDFLKQNELHKALREYEGCVLGLSAGAINMAKVAICTAESEEDKTEIYEGLNLLDISIEPHFKGRGNETNLNELLRISEEHDIYAMCDNGAIVCRGKEQFFYGELYLISKGKIKKVDESLNRN